MQRSRAWLWAVAAVACGGTLGFACGGSNGAAIGSGDDGGTSADAGANVCPACATDNDCNGGVCAQLGGDSYCAPVCPNGNECSSDRQCTPVASVTGEQVSACVPRGGAACSAGGSGGADAGAGSGSAQQCGSLVGPNVPAGCHCSSGKTCTANGCYGGWWCNTATDKCQPPPTSCTGGSTGDGGGGGGGGTPYDGGTPVTGSVGPSGGTVSRLLFAVVGDTRPPSEDDTSAYPTAIVTSIYQHMQALSPPPTFAVSTGDYQFASPTGDQGAAQIDLYLGARAQYSGQLFPTMGNHECTGYTASNCGAGNTDGVTNNYTAFLQKLLGPIHQTSPYYEIDVNASDGSWTSKFLFVAANAWDQNEASWLSSAMSRATTYTILVRHEPASASTAPGVGPAETIMSQHPYTLSLVGHTHTYEHVSGREVIIGNGGAPMSGGKDYGFAMISQQPGGSLAVDMIDYSSGLEDPSFHFAVNPDGSPAP
jgi:hypothetical protein